MKILWVYAQGEGVVIGGGGVTIMDVCTRGRGSDRGVTL